MTDDVLETRWYINAAGNIVTDISIMIMPLPILSKLQMPSKQKYFLIAIFSLGILYVYHSFIVLRKGPCPILRSGIDTKTLTNG